MNENETIFDRNLARLLGESYQPENPDPAFVTDLQNRLRTIAKERAVRQIGDARLRNLRLRLGWVFALAAVIAGLGLFVYAQKSSVAPLQPPTIRIATDMASAASDDSSGGLTARPKDAAPSPDVLAVGAVVKTAAGDRRRLALPDGSILFLNENTSVRLETNRHLKLEAGDLYVEVAPKDGDRFIVSAPGIEAVALGTKFAVDAKGAVTVTQGKVRVNGSDSIVNAGQQLLPTATKPTPAPRATAVLDWLREAMAAADSPLVPGNFRASRLVAFNPNGQEAQISLRKFLVDVHIEDGFARTTIDQTYFNHEQIQLEGTFHFPLPPDASLSRLAMYVNGELMEGGMAERSHARNVYEEIRYNVRRDPALLEWVDGSTFKMRVFPMEARQEKRIVLSYTQRLSPLDGKASYRLPMGHTLNETDRLAVNVRVKNGQGLTWSSPSHALTAVMDGRDLLLNADLKHAKLDRDLQLNLTETAGGPPVKYSAMDDETNHYFMLRYRPNAADLRPAKANAPSPKHYLFLFEASADRDPLLARAQIEIIRAMLDNLEHDDTFSVLSANTRTRMIVSDLKATRENIQKAIAAMEKIHLIGALDLDQAFAAATDALKYAKDAWIVHAGSGVPTLGERREDVLVKRLPDGVRYAGIGVGKRWSRALMKSAADRTGGYFTQINPDEAVTWKAFDFLATLRTARWQNLQVVDDQDRPWLLHDTSLAAGEELCAAIRIRGDAPAPKSVTIRGILNDKPFEQKIDLKTLERNAGYLPRDWAKLEIDRLVAENRDKNQATIVELSKAMYVISPFTSLLVLENEEMYRRFNVDRGRKDHWAIYPCPARIPIVHEPFVGFANYESKPSDKAKSEEAILKSIVIRGTPVLITPPGQPAVGTMTAWERLQLELSPARSNDGHLNFLAAPYVNVSATGFYTDKSAGNNDQSNADMPTRIPATGTTWSSQGFGSGTTSSSQSFGGGGQLGGVGQFGFGGANGSNSLTNNFVPGSSLNGAGNPFGMQGNPGGLGGGIGGIGGGFSGAIGGGGFNNGGGFGGVSGLGGIQGNYHNSSLNGNFSFGSMGGFQNPAWPSHGTRSPTTGAPVGWIWRPQEDSAIATSVRLRQESVTGGPVVPGSHVDVICTTRLPMGKVVTETILQNRLVLAVSSTLEATLAVTPQESRALDSAVQRGETTFVLKLRDDDPLAIASVLPPARTVKQLLYQRPTLGDAPNYFRDLPAFAPGLNTTDSDIAAVLDAESGHVGLPCGTIDDGARAMILKARAAGWRKVKVGDGASAYAVECNGQDQFMFERKLPVGLTEKVICNGTTLWHFYPELGLASKRPFSRFHAVDWYSQVPWMVPPIEELARGADVVRLSDKSVAVIPRGANKNETHWIFGDNGLLRERIAIEMPSRRVLSRVRFGAADFGEAIPERNCSADVSKFVVLNLPYRKVVSSPTVDPLVKYLSNLPAIDNKRYRIPRDGTLSQTLNRLHEIYVQWTQPTANDLDRDATNRLRDFVERNRNEFGYAALVIASQRTDLSWESSRGLAEAWQQFDHDPTLGRLARYERIRCFLLGGMPNTARLTFDDLYRAALAAGDLPPIDETVKKLPPNDNGPWGAVLLRAADDLLANGRIADAVHLAWQALALGEQRLAQDLIDKALPKLVDVPQAIVLDAVAFLLTTGKISLAQELLQPLLDHPKTGKLPEVWRTAADLATRRNQLRRSVEYVDRALELEFERMPAVFDVRQPRAEYAALFAGFDQVVSACKQLETPLPADFVSRVVRAADRWRAFDSDPTRACHAAARLLRELDQPALAWDYLTSPLAFKPNEADPFRNLAQDLANTGNPELAEKAYAAAFAAEPTNTELLWLRVGLLRQLGNATEAKRVLEQIADGEWQPRFDWIKRQARQELGR